MPRASRQHSAYLRATNRGEFWPALVPPAKAIRRHYAPLRADWRDRCEPRSCPKRVPVFEAIPEKRGWGPRAGDTSGLIYSEPGQIGYRSERHWNTESLPPGTYPPHNISRRSQSTSACEHLDRVNIL